MPPPCCWRAAAWRSSTTSHTLRSSVLLPPCPPPLPATSRSCSSRCSRWCPPPPPPSRPLPHRKIVRFALTHWPQPQPHNSAPDQALFERPAPSPLVFIGTFIFLVGLAGYAYAANRDKRQLLCRDGREDGDAEGAPSAEEAYAAQVRAQVQRVKLEPQTPPPRRQTPPATETSTLIGKQVRLK